MKIEKVNDHQIRCTLTSEDLAKRQLKLSDLAYGSEKTKELFHDMMQQASMDFGFDADDIPLMIEAIPISPEKIVLLITKVDAPEELDTRFSQFTHLDSDEEDSGDSLESIMDDAADQLMDLFDQLRTKKEATAKKETEGKTEPEENKTTLTVPSTRHFISTSLDSVLDAAHRVGNFYTGTNTLYKNEKAGEFHLILHQGEHCVEDFNKIVNSVSSYMSPRKCTDSIQAFLEEHYKVIVADQALQTLMQL